jgi:hypothetical protein
MPLTERTERSQTTAPQRRPVVAKVLPPRRRRGVLSRWLVATVLTLGVLLGAVGGYVAYQASLDAPARGRVADVARLQAS